MRFVLPALAVAGFLVAASAQAAPVSAAKGFANGSEITQVAKRKVMRTAKHRKAARRVAKKKAM